MYVCMYVYNKHVHTYFGHLPSTIGDADSKAYLRARSLLLYLTFISFYNIKLQHTKTASARTNTYTHTHTHLSMTPDVTLPVVVC